MPAAGPVAGGNSDGIFNARVLYNQIVARDSNFAMNILLKWDNGYEEAMVVAMTLDNPNRAGEFYGKRFGIEAIHKDWKSNAFKLEKTRVTDPKRIEMLLIPYAKQRRSYRFRLHPVRA